MQISQWCKLYVFTLSILMKSDCTVQYFAISHLAKKNKINKNQLYQQSTSKRNIVISYHIISYHISYYTWCKHQHFITLYLHAVDRSSPALCLQLILTLLCRVCPWWEKQISLLNKWKYNCSLLYCNHKSVQNSPGKTRQSQNEYSVELLH